MLILNYENNETLIAETYDGNLQEAVYEYLTNIEAERIRFKRHDIIELNENNVFDYFEGFVGDKFISSENLAHPLTSEELLLNVIIISVFRRFSKNRELIKKETIRKANNELILDIITRYSMIQISTLSSDKKEKHAMIEQIRKFTFDYKKDYI